MTAKIINYVDKLPQIKKIAENYGGKCLSNNYVNNRSLLIFECEFGHQWETVWKNINKGSWCPQCAIINATGINNNRFDTLENMQKIATERGGKCLSNEYLGAHTKLKWQCNLGHEWIAKPNAIKNGSWCPQCSIGIGERFCKIIFETIFYKTFIKVRPDWLVNPITNKNLELDGYCEELNIAFEYNGEQHYSDNTIYPRSKYDLLKIQKCQSHGVRLFIIKEIKSAIKYKEIIEEIVAQAQNYNINVDTNIFISINDAYKSNSSILFLEELKDIAIKNGGVCLSSVYVDSNYKLDFQCGVCNYVWQSAPNNIKSGRWCPQCANKNTSINNAIELATNHNGKCLSSEYINSITKMSWECELQHQWQATYNQIQSGGWCPECFKLNRGKGKKIGIDIYRKVAINKGGECLSTEINSCYDKLEWKCKEGHIWLARGDMIKNTKQWCPQCAKDNKRKIK